MTLSMQQNLAWGNAKSSMILSQESVSAPSRCFKAETPFGPQGPQDS